MASQPSGLVRQGNITEACFKLPQRPAVPAQTPPERSIAVESPSRTKHRGGVNGSTTSTESEQWSADIFWWNHHARESVKALVCAMMPMLGHFHTQVYALTTMIGSALYYSL